MATLFIFSLFAAQLVRLQGLEAASVAARGEKRREVTTTVMPDRGAIIDRNGSPVAWTVDRRAVIASQVAVTAYTKLDPSTKKRVKVGVEGAAQDLSPLLAMPVADLRKLLTGSRGYVVLARSVEPVLWRKIEDLGIPGVSSESRPERGYPAGPSLASVVGYAPIISWSADKVMRHEYGAGLELLYNDTLEGAPGEILREVSVDGITIPMGNEVVTPASPGRDVKLTLDRDLSWFTYNAVAQQVQKTKALRGYAVVMDRTGHILATGQYPTFDPSNRSLKGANFHEYVFGDTFEPGSTAKVMSIGAALQEGVVTPTDVYTVPDKIKVSDVTLKDSHAHPTERMTVAGILAQSSNVGTIEVARQLPRETLERYYRAFGAGQKSATNFPGESAGLLKPSSAWLGSEAFTVMYGQGVGMSAIQAAGVFQTIANDGVRVPATMVAGSQNEDGTFEPAAQPEGQRVVSVETARQLRTMMESVVGERGTAEQAKVPGYRIAGKTGTSLRYSDGGGYTASFVGMAPAENPQLIVAVFIQRPRAGYYGGAIAGPVFKDVMTQALKTFNVTPSTQVGTLYPLFEGATADKTSTTSAKPSAKPSAASTPKPSASPSRTKASASPSAGSTPKSERASTPKGTPTTSSSTR